MARLIPTDNRNYEVVSMTRAEAAALVRDITHLLLFTSGTAPSLEITSETRTYQLLFQTDKKVEESGIDPPDTRSPPMLLCGWLEDCEWPRE